MNKITIIDRIPKKELENRYNIKRVALGNRIDVLKIKPILEGRNSYISGEDLKKLDKLHYHLEAGGTFSNFAETAIISHHGHIKHPSQARITISSEQKLAQAIKREQVKFVRTKVL